MATIALRNIRKTFGETDVLKGLDLTIENGQFISLVGPSGCGKSTLLRIIAGLETQTSGEVAVDGRRMEGVRPASRNLAMVFQSYALYPHLSVFDNIAVPLRMQRLSTLQRAPLVGSVMPGRRREERTIDEEVRAISRQLDIEHLLTRKPAQLSGGQKQRVAVARAIVRRPKAFLFDEPLSNLDAKLRVHMRSELAQLHRRLEATFIYVTHDQAEAMTMSDRIAVMMDGEIVQIGEPADIYANPQDIRVAEFIGSPKINILPGRISADGAVYAMDHAIGRAATAQPGPCRIGVRPENIGLSYGPFGGTIVHVENMGAEAFVHLRVDAIDQPVVIRQPDVQKIPAVGAWQSFGFSTDAARLFDQSGRCVAFAPLTSNGVKREASVG